MQIQIDQERNKMLKESAAAEEQQEEEELSLIIELDD